MPEFPVRETLRRLRRDAKWSWEYRSGLVRRFVVSRWWERLVPRAERDRTQERHFADLGLSRAAGLAEIDRALAACRLDAYDEDHDMFSEHLVLLAALALRHRGARRVLEIGTYDVVWADGDHQFPVIAVDLANAVRLLRPGGHLLCDDVFVARTRRSSIHLSDAAHRSLGALRDAGLIEAPTYLYKRLGTPHQSPRKFVAIAATRGR